jgi:hypothetical protein
MKNYTFLALLLAGLWLPVAAQVQSPVEFLPHPYGQAFTPHHLLVDYLEHVATESPRVSLKEYGTSYERRPSYLRQFQLLKIWPGWKKFVWIIFGEAEFWKGTPREHPWPWSG